MEAILLWLIVLVIVTAALLAIVRSVPDVWLDPWLKRACSIAIVAVFLVLLIVRVIWPLLATMPGG